MKLVKLKAWVATTVTPKFVVSMSDNDLERTDEANFQGEYKSCNRPRPKRTAKAMPRAYDHMQYSIGLIFRRNLEEQDCWGSYMNLRSNQA